ncbi:MAG: pantoate--beta-alanine ligase [Bacteroidales bacterium]|nr:pantoate--beta-alanine ligase [Bacteroidales bacterium]
MLVVSHIADVKSYINQQRSAGKKIGFVPTMGALHEGHLSLIYEARKHNDIVTASIFVNPIQFNNPGDLEKYPRTEENDCRMLEQAGCDMVFIPNVKEMYPEEVKKTYDFGNLETVMEGQFRPGHFNGVAIVVKKLFDIFTPHQAFFGQKDFQQLAIIRRMVELENIPVEVIGCPTLREIDGLAMSSRNIRLSENQRKSAPFIFKMLELANQLLPETEVIEVHQHIVDKFANHPDFELEYFEICNAITLQPIKSLNDAEEVVACVAAYMGEVRLIDNRMMKP